MQLTLCFVFSAYVYVCAWSQESMFWVSLEIYTINSLIFSFCPLFFTKSVYPGLLHCCCCCSLTRLCPTLCDPVDCSTRGFPVLPYLPEFAQTHVHRVGDAIQPSHPLSPPSPPAFNLSQHQGLFQWVGSSHQVAKYWSFNFSISPSSEYSGLLHKSFLTESHMLFLLSSHLWSPYSSP